MDRDQKERLLLDLLPQIKIEAAKAARRSQFVTAADFYQEACIATWTALDDYDAEIGPLWTFVGSCIMYRFLTLWNYHHAKCRFLPQQPEEVNGRFADYRDNWTPEEFERLTEPCRANDREILRAIYVDGFTQEEIGEHLGVSHQRIGQMHRRGLTAIRARELSK